jgi:hypothetical protein
MTALTILHEPLASLDARPGMAYETVELELPPTATVIVRELAGLDGLPVGLWAALAVESERARGEADADALDEAARELAPPPPYPSRLTAYAAALRAARPVEPVREPIAMPVAHHTLLAWTHAAEGSLLAWICTLLERMPRRRHLWEAAAAERGLTLAEWVITRAAAGSTPPRAWRPGS